MARHVPHDRIMDALQAQMRDAHEAMRLAIADCRWNSVAKYAAQLETMAAEHVRLFGAVYQIAANGLTSWTER